MIFAFYSNSLYLPIGNKKNEVHAAERNAADATAFARLISGSVRPLRAR